MIALRRDNWSPFDNSKPLKKNRETKLGPYDSVTTVQFQSHPAQPGKTRNNNYEHLCSFNNNTNVVEAVEMYYEDKVGEGPVLDKSKMMLYVTAATNEDETL